MSPRPDTGNQPRITEKIMIIIKPSQNVGIDIPRTEPPMIILVPKLFGFKPAYIPKGNPKTIAIISAHVASSNVAGKRSAINASAGLPKIKEFRSIDFSILLRNERVAMGMVSSVPAGIYSKQALVYLNQWDAISKQVVQADNVRTALQYLISESVNFGIVYASDAYLFPELKVLGIFDDFTHDPIIYPASLINPSSLEADLFFKYLVRHETLQVFEEYGFLTLSGIFVGRPNLRLIAEVKRFSKD